MTALAASGAPSRRDEIVDIARRIFAERGYTNTSMRDIAEASGLMAGSLYSHFRSKAEILRLVLSPLVDELEPGQEAVLASEGSGLARFDLMIHTVLGVLEVHRDETTIMHYDWSELSETPELTDLAQRSNHLLALWQQVIVAGQEDGSIRADVRPGLVVRAATSALHASVDSKRFAEQSLPTDAQERSTVADELTVLFASGIGAVARPARRPNASRSPIPPSRRPRSR